MQATFQAVISNVAVVLYQGDNLRTLVVTRFILSNSGNNPENVSVFLVPPGGTPTINNAVIHQVKLSANTYIEGQGGFVVPPQYSVQVQCTDPAVVVATLSGDLAVIPIIVTGGG